MKQILKHSIVALTLGYDFNCIAKFYDWDLLQMIIGGCIITIIIVGIMGLLWEFFELHLFEIEADWKDVLNAIILGVVGAVLCFWKPQNVYMLVGFNLIAVLVLGNELYGYWKAKHPKS